MSPFFSDLIQSIYVFVFLSPFLPNTLSFEEPEAVEGFTVLAYTTDTVDLDWTLPAKCNDDGCVWSSFDLSYGVTGQGETMKKALPRDNSSDVIENLTPGESYDFSITVLSDEEYSEAVNVTQRTSKSCSIPMVNI